MKTNSLLSETMGRVNTSLAPSFMGQILLNGLISGLVIALLGLAFTIASLPARIFHLALAGIYTIVPFIVWSMWTTNCARPWGVVIALAIGVLLSLLCELLNHAPLDRKGASDVLHFVSSLGIAIIMVQIAAMIWGSDTRVLRRGPDWVIGWLTLQFTHSQLLSGGISVCLLTLVVSWLQFSKHGLQLQALADNPIQLALFGFKIFCFRRVAFALSGLLAGAAALLTAYDTGFAAHGGLDTLLLSVVAVIVGGRKTWCGPILAGVLLGILRAFVTWALSSHWQDAVTYGLLVVFLFIRPQGLLGRQTRIEATF